MKVLALVLLMGKFAAAQTSTFVIEPSQSNVAFTLPGNLHTVNGTFQVANGKIKFDRKAPEMSGTIDVTAASGASGNESRDHRMTQSILEASRFTTVSFNPQKMLGTVAETGDSTIEVSGIFTLHGVSHPLTVPVTLHMEGGRCIAKTRFVVPYVQWQLKNPSTFVFRMAKEVSIDLTLAGKVTSNP